MLLKGPLDLQFTGPLATKREGGGIVHLNGIIRLPVSIYAPTPTPLFPSLVYGHQSNFIPAGRSPERDDIRLFINDLVLSLFFCFFSLFSFVGIYREHNDDEAASRSGPSPITGILLRILDVLEVENRLRQLRQSTILMTSGTESRRN